MPGEAEGTGSGTTAVGNTQTPNSPTESLGRTPETSLDRPASSSPLTEALTPRAALERLKARRELAPTQETEHGTPAPPAGPEKPSGGTETAKAAQTPSVDDEVEGLLSGPSEPDDSTEEAPSASDDDPFVFEVDGKQIPRSEAQKGYLRGQDFTVKTQSLAEVRKTFETEIQAVSEDRKRYGSLLGEQLQALRANEPQMPDQAMKVTDPVGYSDRVVEYLAHQDQVRQREAQIGQLVQEQRQADQKLFELKKAEETAKMLESVPSLAKAKDDDQRGKLLSRFKQTAMDAGFAEGELNRLVDHRVIRILEWATIGKAVQKGTVKGHKSQAAARANGSNGSAPSLLPTSSLRSTGGGGTPDLKTKPTREVQTAQEAFEKRGGNMRDGVALLRTLRHARGAS
jgi:hypothetical protein